jgi:hypothetical protein
MYIPIYEILVKHSYVVELNCKCYGNEDETRISEKKL